MYIVLKTTPKVPVDGQSILTAQMELCIILFLPYGSAGHPAGIAFLSQAQCPIFRLHGQAGPGSHLGLWKMDPAPAQQEMPLE